MFAFKYVCRILGRCNCSYRQLWDAKRYWKLNLFFLKEHSVLLTDEPFPQPLLILFYFYLFIWFKTGSHFSGRPENILWRPRSPWTCSNPPACAFLTLGPQTWATTPSLSVIFFLLFIFLLWVSLYTSGCFRSPDQVGLKYTESCLALPPVFWDQRCAPGLSVPLGPVSMHISVTFLLLRRMQDWPKLEAACQHDEFQASHSYIAKSFTKNKSKSWDVVQLAEC